MSPNGPELRIQSKFSIWQPDRYVNRSVMRNTASDWISAIITTHYLTTIANCMCGCEDWNCVCKCACLLSNLQTGNSACWWRSSWQRRTKFQLSTENAVLQMYTGHGTAYLVPLACPCSTAPHTFRTAPLTHNSEPCTTSMPRHRRTLYP